MRGLILGLAVGLAVLLTSGEGRAGYITGRDLNEVCNKDNYYSKGQCLGYIEGVHDAGSLIDKATDKRQWDSDWTACVPKGVTAGQLWEVVKKWLREHPADWHYTADSLVANALAEAFPCR